MMTVRWPEVSPASAHWEFYEHIKNGGVVHRSDPLNAVEEDLTLEKLGGDANSIQQYGYLDLSIVLTRKDS